MPRNGLDQHEEGLAPERLRSGAPGAAGRSAWARLSLQRAWGLPLKLLLLTVVFVMLAEVLIFVPSVANFRVKWLNDRLVAAGLASLAAEAVPGGQVPESLRAELLRSAEVKAVALRREGRRRMVLPPQTAVAVDAHYDLRPKPGLGMLEDIALRAELIGEAMAVFFRPGDRMLRVVGPQGTDPEDFIEVVLPEAPLRAAMLRYGLNILGLSIIISLVTAALVYLALSTLLVRPMMRITRNMLDFSRNPEDTSRIIEPSGRSDEIGVAERELAAMQRQLIQLLKQKNRLAQLGLAVSKINHDLRNMLASAQLISDRLTDVPDPTVQRFAPKLIASLDRAISFCSDTLRFGRAEEAEPRRELMLLKPLVEDVGDGLGLPREGEIDWRVEIEDQLRVDADREHLYRILSNLTRNAAQALEHGPPDGSGPTPGAIIVRARREGRRVIIEVEDTGPGVPARTREDLFTAFKASKRKGGTGLGLAISAELVQAHGGQLHLAESQRGALFRIELPDRRSHEVR